MRTTSRYPEYKKHRLNGLSSRAAAIEVGMSAHGGYKHERTFEMELGEHDYLQFQSPQSRRSKNICLNSTIKAKLDLVIASPISEMSSVELGSLAEDFVYYHLRRRGFQVLRPLYPHRQLDIIILLNGISLRCEVKSTRGKSCVLKHTIYKDGAYKRVAYEADGVDFFFLVDLVHENIFIVPSAHTAGKVNFGVTPGSEAWKFKDRYDLLTSNQL